MYVKRNSGKESVAFVQEYNGATQLYTVALVEQGGSGMIKQCREDQMREGPSASAWFEWQAAAGRDTPSTGRPTPFPAPLPAPLRVQAEGMDLMVPAEQLDQFEALRREEAALKTSPSTVDVRGAATTAVKVAVPDGVYAGSQFTVAVPDGVYAGGQFTVEYEGKPLKVVCPDGCGPGDEVHVSIDVPSAVDGSGGRIDDLGDLEEAPVFRDENELGRGYGGGRGGGKGGGVGEGRGGGKEGGVGKGGGKGGFDNVGGKGAAQQVAIVVPDG